MESCQESFILRLYRQKNKTGFVKAFSGSPIAFTTGFCKVDRVMRNLFVRNLYLWPRFHANVAESLKEHTPDVIELHVDMTSAMKTIQTAILDLMNFTLQELKRLNPSLSGPIDDRKDDDKSGEEKLSVENALSKSFHKTLQQELDPVWHQLSWRTKQLVSDMKTLRTILVHLTNYDAITFYAFVSALRTTENAMRSGGWMILDSAESLFMTAKARVFGDQSGCSDVKKAKTETAEEDKIIKYDFEECPKWQVLSEILKEIKEEVGDDEELKNSTKTLVLTADERVTQQLTDFLNLGKHYIFRIFLLVTN